MKIFLYLSNCLANLVARISLMIVGILKYVECARKIVNDFLLMAIAHL
jgi:hypothetical protein